MKVTNYHPGPRGVNLKNKPTLWVEPGQTVEFDKGDVVGDLPDFGKAPTAAADADKDLAAANEQIETLTGILKERDATIAEQAKQIETLTKPADPKKDAAKA